MWAFSAAPPRGKRGWRRALNGLQAEERVLQHLERGGVELVEARPVWDRHARDDGRIHARAEENVARQRGEVRVKWMRLDAGATRDEVLVPVKAARAAMHACHSGVVFGAIQCKS